jgi:hypothetical protein
MACVLFASSLLWAGAPGEMPGPDALPSIPGLPDPFLFSDGTRVNTPDDWQRRREEIITMLLRHQYGAMPPAPDSVRAETGNPEPVFDGLGTYRAVTLRVGPGDGIPVRAGLYVPSGGDGLHPVVLALEPVWDPALEPVAQEMLSRGYAFAGYALEDLDRDDADRSDGLHPLYPEHDWATLSVWAWGAMRMVDYLLTCPEIDAGRIAITGHSRRGKTALLAGALDTRIALTAPHASGAGGAGCWRFNNPDAESLDAITDPERFGYWFVPGFRAFAGREDRLPFDQHFLKALVAPRGLLCYEALGDPWANPGGTWITTRAAGEVFSFLGAADRNAAWWRPGGHAMTPDDWTALLDFADVVFFGKPPARDFGRNPFPVVPPESPDWARP